MADSVGVHRRTGTVVTDFDHVLSSIEDLLTTRRLSRVMLRQYGSDFPDLIDAPMTDRSLVLFFSAIATALEIWEPRYAVTKVAFVDAGPDGRTELALVGEYRPRAHYGDLTPAGAIEARFRSVDGVFQALIL